MARLVDADNIVSGIALYMAENAYLNDTPLDVLKMVANRITEAPTVEVVRCKDCKYWGQDVSGYSGDDESFCTNPDGLDNYAHPDDFCSYGERRTDG